ncbi:hypothetical protein [Streptomyces venezuelae]
MEVLLIAVGAWLAFTAGAQSEQAKLGVSPAQRDQMREQTRHEKAIQKIAQKHGVGAPSAPAASAPQTAGGVPGTFLSGYRSHRPVHPPMGARAGEWAGRGVTWAQDTGRNAWQSYRKRRKDAGHDDPGPVLVPLPPSQPPHVPPMPAHPPAPAPATGEDGAMAKPVEAAKPKVPAEPPPAPAPAPKQTPKEPSKDDVDTAKKPSAPAPGADPDADLDRPLAPAPEDAGQQPKHPPTDTSPPAAETPRPDPTQPRPADKLQGVGRMAAEVTYDSVMDESDELSAMCDDDLHTYDRIKARAEREIGRGDTLATQVLSTGFGATIHAIVVRCREQYQIIHNAIDDLKQNTVAQHEAVIKAKDALERGQGLYADIAKDMEDVAERDAYLSDAVDSEDANAEAEHYETKAVA